MMHQISQNTFQNTLQTYYLGIVITQGVEKLIEIHSYIFIAEDWQADNYRWDNGGVSLLPQKDPCLKRQYFYIHTPQGISKDFHRHAYQLLEEKTINFIHFVGNNEVAMDFCYRGA